MLTVKAEHLREGLQVLHLTGKRVEDAAVGRRATAVFPAVPGGSYFPKYRNRCKTDH